jgi:hypothetical protein
MDMGLKSSAAVIQRVCPLIGEARGAGFSHRAIYDALCAGGLPTTWTNYRIALGRAIKVSNRPAAAVSGRRRSGGELAVAFEGAPVRNDDLRHAASHSAPRTAIGPEELKSWTSGTSTATRVMDALRQAREVANSKDYGQIARDRYRQEQRDRRRKDRP